VHNLITPQRVARIRACRVDLLTSGIDLAAMGPTSLDAFVRAHLEYFQCMLGDDSSHRHVVALLRHELLPRAGSSPIDAKPQPAHPPAHAELDPDARAARIERRRQAMAHMTLDELFAATQELRRLATEVAEQLDLLQERLGAMCV
jgi:hypothetical protein